MANRYWLGTTSTNHATAANWSASSGGAGGASVPGTGDVANFDGNGNNPCTVTAHWALGGLVSVAGYTSKLDLATYNLTMDDGANVTMDMAGEFDLGTGAISLTNGDWDTKDVSTQTYGAAGLTLNGTGTLMEKGNGFWTLTIAAGANITLLLGVGYTQVHITLTVNGTFNIPSGHFAQVTAGGTMVMGSSGVVTGDGDMRFLNSNSGKGLTTFPAGATLDTAVLWFRNTKTGSVTASGTYGSALVLVSCDGTGNRGITFGSGAVVFEGNLELNTSSTKDLSVLNLTNGPASITVQGDLIVDIDSTGGVIIDDTSVATEWVIQGDVVDEKTGAGAFTWTAGSGSLTASGTAAQDWDLMGASVPDVVVNKASGTLTLSGTATTESFTLTSGTVDFNGQTFESTGNFTIPSTGNVASAADAMNGAAITVGGVFSASGSAGDQLTLLATASWTLDVTGAATANYVDVSYSDASGGTQVTARNSTNNGNTVNWDFTDSVATSQWMRRRRRWRGRR